MCPATRAPDAVEFLGFFTAVTGEVVAAQGYQSSMRAVPSLLLFLLLALAPTAASAVTLEQIVALSKAGISEPIILAMIERDKTVFTIDPDQLVALKRDGVSETIILAMLKSGREEGEAAATAAAALNTAAIMNTLSPYPEVVIVGHGPDRPNTMSNEFRYPSISDFIPGPMFYDAPYYGSPSFVYGASSFGSRRFPRRSFTQTFPPATVTPVPPPPSLSSPAVCIAQSTGSAAPPQVGSRGFVTVCPPALQLQPRRRR